MPESRSRWLLFGPWQARYPTGGAPSVGVHRLIRIHADGGHFTRVVTWRQLPDEPSVYHYSAGNGLVPADETLRYDGLILSVHQSRELPDAMPLALLADDSPDGWDVYLPIRLGPVDALFHRVDRLATKHHEPQPSADTLDQVLAQLPDYSKTVGSHECWYFKHDPDYEYEHKLTLDPDLDIYSLTRDIHNEIGHGDLRRYRAEYRNDFELWQFRNHMFEVTGPADTDRGYLSFIPRLNGGYTLKRKLFQHDGFRRVERKTYWPQTHATLDEMDTHVRQRLGLDARYLGGFDRIRFDDMLESADTGHIYSLMTDRCTFTGHRIPLQQLEIEYIRSRGDVRDCQRQIVSELDHLKTWTQTFLDNRGIGYTADYRSKYTHLRQLTSGPGQGPVTGAGAVSETLGHA
ncbi:hypothetical protein [Nocardia alni]|uniref:hypothetical protein n=1 Tax=Nocardia alni TaxID=2815723 RepID=UPI001C243935|nr:hypothetical protein [Nocardia alni]